MKSLAPYHLEKSAGPLLLSAKKTAASQRLAAVLWRRDRDSNPGCPYGHNGFRDRPDRPLRHLSFGVCDCKVSYSFLFCNVLQPLYLRIIRELILFELLIEIVAGRFEQIKHQFEAFRSLVVRVRYMIILCRKVGKVCHHDDLLLGLGSRCDEL